VSPREAAVESLSFEQLLARLQEAEETLDAIRLGHVDAVVVGGPQGQQVYTLENADRPYRAIIEQMQEGAFTIQAEGVLLYCNQRFATLLGRQRESLIGKPIGHYFGRGASAFMALLAHAGEAGTGAEFSLVHDSGEMIPVTVSLIELAGDLNTPRMICGVVTDLTRSLQRSHELTAANAQLASEIRDRQRAEAGLQLALDAAEMGYWDLDLTIGDGRTSRRHDDIFGYQDKLRDWSFGRFLEHVVVEDRAAVEKFFGVGRTAPSIEFSCRIERAGDGARRWLQVKGLSYSTPRGPRLSGVVIDMTKARETEEQLRQAQKMEAVGQLTGGLAHDFNNLLGGIIGSLEMIEARIAEGRVAEVERYVDVALHSAKRAASLTQRLLAFSRRQTLSPKIIDVNALVVGMEDLIRRSIGPSIRLEVIGAAGLWSTLVDPPQLENALLNLSINARDAMPHGGTLTIETANVRLDDGQANERDLQPGKYITLSVRDTGVGMSKEVASRAFDPFFTTKPLGQGTGLGLSMIYGFARQSGGQIQILSEKDRGTTITLYLPRNAAAPARIESDRRPLAADIEGAGKLVLVVDDEPSIRMLVAEVLNEAGFATLEASDGPSALRIMEMSAKIDLLITDVGLPGGMNGRQLADAVCALRPTMKILFITGYAENVVVGSGRLDHGMQVLTKPFTMNVLKKRIQQMLPG